jgi:short-subunit dehydrogenase
VTDPLSVVLTITIAPHLRDRKQSGKDDTADAASIKGEQAMTQTRRGDGQTALVTGASVGIGVDLAECFAGDGYDVILAARTEHALRAVADRLAKTYGIRATPIVADLGVIGGGQRLADAIQQAGLSVDVVVNNAGYGLAGGFAGSDAAGQLGMVDLNDRAVVELTHIYWPRLLANRRGGVLNVASTAAFQPGPLMAVYYASKAFVLSFSEALWEEARATGVKVSCLCPGPTVSQFRERAGTDKVRLSQSGAQMPTMAVARLGYDAWQHNRRVEVTGSRNRLMASLVRFLPRTLLLRMVRNLQSPK